MASDFLSRDRASLSYTYELAPNLRVLMVDANTGDYPGSAAPRTLSWVKSQLRDAARDGAWVVAVCHQNLLQHSSLFSGGYRLGNAEKAAARFNRAQLENSLCILQQLDLDLKRSKLDGDLLLQKALCQLALAGGRR